MVMSVRYALPRGTAGVNNLRTRETASGPSSARARARGDNNRAEPGAGGPCSADESAKTRTGVRREKTMGFGIAERPTIVFRDANETRDRSGDRLKIR